MTSLLQVSAGQRLRENFFEAILYPFTSTLGEPLLALLVFGSIGFAYYQVQRSITEIQASQLLAYQQEQTFLLRGIQSILRDGLGVSSDVGTTPASGGGGDTTINASVNVTSEMTAEETATLLEDAFQEMN